jgi:fatty-acyl-CoA synthase
MTTTITFDHRSATEQPRTELSYARGPSDVALLEETIGDNLDRTVTLHGDRDALVEFATGRRFSYTQLQAEVDALAHGLLRLGIAKGDRIGIWAPNCAEWMQLQYATAKIGAILVCINPAYRTHEVEYVLSQAGVRMLVAAPSFRKSDYAAMIAEVRPACPALEHVVLIGSAEWEALPDRDGDPARLAAQQAALDPHEAINIQYTSGTTGHPKGATLSHHNILNNAYQIGEVCRYTEADRICVPVPLFHIFGMVIGNLAATTRGAALVYPTPAFDPAATLAAVAAERCTSLYGVPTMFIAELGVLDGSGPATYDLSSLRTGMMAGSPCPVEVMKQVVDRMGMTEVTIGYGMTETSPLSTQTRPDDSLERRVSTVGRVHPHVEIAIVDPETGSTVPRGVPGEFCTRGYSVMLGYWDEPDRTAEAVDAEGWMHTGDLAVMDRDGYVNITGRIKDMLIRGGENVYPREIEEFLHTHPDVLDVQVVGVPDARYGEEVMAWIMLRPGAAELTVDDVRTFATGRLAHYKIPRYVRIVDGFPMTVSGKVRKVEMRRVSIELLGLGDVAATTHA